IRETLAALGIEFDEWFSQASIEDGDAVAETIALLRDRGLVFEEDGAVWLRTGDFGDPREQRVLVKSDGELTYLAGDLAYHRDKFLVRKFDRVIDVFGADHQGQVDSLLAGVEALGVERGRLEIEIGQMVSLVSGKMSKRAGNFVPLRDLVDDLGPDVTRLLSLLTSLDSAPLLDLDKVRATRPSCPRPGSGWSRRRASASRSASACSASTPRNECKAMAGPLPRHLLPHTASVGEGGRLSVGGCDVVGLADELGTPLFVY